jgi:hypothetical protein
METIDADGRRAREISLRISKELGNFGDIAFDRLCYWIDDESKPAFKANYGTETHNGYHTIRIIINSRRWNINCDNWENQ